MELKDAIIKLILHLYTILSFSRNDVDFIINLISEFISKYYMPSILNKIKNALENAVSENVLTEIERICEKNKYSFEGLESESKRLIYLKNQNLYCEPQQVIVGSNGVKKWKRNTLFLSRQNVNIIQLSLKNSLTKLFQIKGLFNAMELYMKKLYCQTYVLENFIQGSLWKEKLERFKSIKDSFVVPLIIYFDDVETGNPLDSHAGKNSIGGIYVSIPCFKI